MGKNIHALLQTEWTQPWQAIQEVLIEQGNWQGELIRTKQDGTKNNDRPVAGLCSGTRKINPRLFWKLATILADANCRKLQRQKAPREYSRYLRAERPAVGMAQASLEGKLLLVNQKLCDFFGYCREELIGKNFQEITHPEDRNLELKYLHQLLAERN